MVSRDQVVVGCEPDPKRFRVAKEAVARHFANAAVNSGTDDELSGYAAEVAVKMETLVLEVTTKYPL